MELTAEDVQRDFAGYEVVLAYGAEPIVPGFMTGFKQVMTADDLLAGRAFPGKKIVIVDFAGYEVVLAYGAEPIVPGFMTGFKQVMTADDLLAGRAFPGKKIVIVGGGSVGCETADYLAPLVNDLAPSNRDVTLIEMTRTLAANEGGAGRAVLVTRILDKGVHVLTEARYPHRDDAHARRQRGRCRSCGARDPNPGQGRARAHRGQAHGRDRGHHFL